MKRIAVLTSGGDAPGMNAAIRAVVRVALSKDIQVLGVRSGFSGLIANELWPMERRAVGNILQYGGTVLMTSRSSEFLTTEGREQARQILRKHRVDGLVLIGGDGTLRGGQALHAEGGPPFVLIPATIDNDVLGTDRSIGFDTAVNTAVDAIDRIRDTAASHELLHFIEVMGRKCGQIALIAGVAGGAEAAITPESPTDLDALCHRIRSDLEAGKRGVIVVVAEGGHPDGARGIAAEIGRAVNLDYRVTILGHTQRGGRPTAADRVLGSRLGSAAVQALVGGKTSVLVGEVRGDVCLTPADQVLAGAKTLDDELVALVNLLA